MLIGAWSTLLSVDEVAEDVDHRLGAVKTDR
jgi:hypothetical protein